MGRHYILGLPLAPDWTEHLKVQCQFYGAATSRSGEVIESAQSVSQKARPFFGLLKGDSEYTRTGIHTLAVVAAKSMWDASCYLSAFFHAFRSVRFSI